MNDNREPAGNAGESLSDQFIKLGENIRDIVKAAWESGEGERFRQDIRNGLSELEVSLDKLSRELSESQAAQQIREEMDEIAQRVRSGDVEKTVRTGILTALKRLNEEIEKLMEGMDREIKDQPPGI